LTASYAQTGDTITCYNNTELRHIASRVVRASECDTLLCLAEDQLVIKDSIIISQYLIIEFKDSTLSLKDSIIVKQDSIVYNKDLYIDELTLEVDNLGSKLKWTKVGWIGTGVGLVMLWLVSVL